MGAAWITWTSSSTCSPSEEREYYDLERLWRDAPRVGWNGSEQAAPVR
jgi:hypothetical protein